MLQWHNRSTFLPKALRPASGHSAQFWCLWLLATPHDVVPNVPFQPTFVVISHARLFQAQAENDPASCTTISRFRRPGPDRPGSLRVGRHCGLACHPGVAEVDVATPSRRTAEARWPLPVRRLAATARPTDRQFLVVRRDALLRHAAAVNAR